MKDHTYQPKEDSGNLFKIPADERKSDKHPEYEGEFKTRCPHCQQSSIGWVKGWIREAKNGSKYFSLAFKHRQKRSDAA
jgi:beta-lactamase class D